MQSKQLCRKKMKTFILIHGSWHGAWNWHKVMPLLEQAGHKVIALDLPGMGRDKTPIADVRMENTVQFICNVIDGIEGKVILVGHSKNGIMISQAAEYRPDKIEMLVYLAAYLIPDGKTQREYSLMDTEGWLKPFVLQHPETNSHTLLAEIHKEGLYHDCDESISRLAGVLLSHEPVESGITPLRLTDQKFGSIPRIYIECTADRAVTPFIQRKMYEEMPCKEVFRIDSGHSPFFSMPQELAGILNSL
jgi:pimeloyl-ACP methyl ester carboxylesterase